MHDCPHDFSHNSAEFRLCDLRAPSKVASFLFVDLWLALTRHERRQ